MNDVGAKEVVDVCTRCGSNEQVHVYFNEQLSANFCEECATDLQLWSAERV